MPYQSTLGKGNLKWLLTEEEIDWIKEHIGELTNRELQLAFNHHFNCDISYSRFRHFKAQYGLNGERGEAYTQTELEYVKANYLEMSDMHMGIAIGRTTKSVMKLRLVAQLKRSPESTNRLRLFRSQSGAKTLHERIKRGEIQSASQSLSDGFVKMCIRKGTDLTVHDDIPQPLIKMKRAALKINRELKKYQKNESESKKTGAA